MVVFTCNHCGESLHKPKVAKHYQFKCRKPEFVSCIDCQKDFRAEEYIAHTKCITENERYGGVGYVPKPNSNKGEQKQNEWLNVVQNLLNNSQNLSHQERNMLNSLCDRENIPRKKAKFLNFIRSAFQNRFPNKLVESVWDKMEGAYKEAIASKNSDKEVKNGTTSSETAANNRNVAENENNENISREKNKADNEVENGETKKGKKKGKKQKVEELKENSEIEKEESVKKQKKNKMEGLEVTLENGKEKRAKKKEKKKKQLDESGENENNVGHVAEEKREKKGKKRMHVESNDNEKENAAKKQHLENGNSTEDAKETETTEATKFDWKTLILEAVQAKQEISLKKLKKKIVSLYLEQCSNVTQEKAISKFNKKINKTSGISIENNKVRIA